MDPTDHTTNSDLDWQLKLSERLKARHEEIRANRNTPGDTGHIHRPTRVDAFWCTDLVTGKIIR